MSSSDKKKTAIILSGGGANGAYEVGILKALLSGQSPTTNYQPLEPDIIVGTSIGSFNAAFLVSQWDEYGSSVAGNLEQLWLEHLAGGWHDNGVFRIRANPLDLVRPSHLLSDPVQRITEWFQDAGRLAWDGLQRGVHFVTARNESLEQRSVELIDLTGFISTEPMEKTLREIDYERIRRSSRWLKIAATNWATGELKVFWNHDMTDDFGPLAIRASSSIPGFFPVAEYGAQPYCDGSVLLNTPLSPAIHAGAEVLHVIYLDPDIKNIPLAHFNNIYDTLLRMMQITWAAGYNDDIGDAERINRALGALERVDRGEGSGDLLEELFQVAPDLEKYRQNYRPLTIFRYHPHTPLKGELGFFNFTRDRLAELIEQGFQDAIYHDFEESEDIFPAGQEPPVNPRKAAREKDQR